MYDHLFDVELIRKVDISKALSVSEVDMTRGSVGGNLQYEELGQLNWQDVADVLKAEERLLDIADGLTFDQLDDEEFQDEVYEHQCEFGLDVGVGSAAYALSVLGCAPFSSCNGGAFGGHHGEDYPLIAFYNAKNPIERIMHLADKANLGIENGEDGALVLYANNVKSMMLFAQLAVSEAASNG